jgi:S-adenosylmethionine/arginine decarboxylase-like enzyme
MIAIDIFMCGSANPSLALKRIKYFWQPKHIDVQTHRRGIVEPHKVPNLLTK